MKKLMISTIILLPLIVLAIMLVSGAIMSLVTHIFVESVEFVENSALVLEMDDETAPPQEQLLVTVLPLKAENRDLVYTVDDENIVSVDGNGLVTAKGFGETYITVTSLENSAATAKRKVIVTDDSVHSVVLGEHARDLYRGDDPFRLSVEVLPEGATDKRVTWSSSAPEILSVTQSGEVKCLGKGTATVTVASVEDPAIAATMEFTCHIPLRSISAETTPVETAKERAQFPAISPVPEDATYALEYASSDRSVATVDQTGAIVFHSAGPVTITATAADGRGNTDSVSVRYVCTFGYYLGRLFDRTEYTFDYDTLAGEELSALAFRSDLDDCYQRIDRVEFRGPDLIEYDDAAKKFTLKNVGDGTELGTVEITVYATKYDRASGTVKAFSDDVCTVTVTRQTRALSFVANGEAKSEVSITSKSVNLSELSGGSDEVLGVRAEPANHTDELTYALKEECACAHLDGTMLQFEQAGTAVVSVSAGTAYAELTVVYTQPKQSDKVVTLQEGSEEQSISLSYTGADTSNEGVLQFGAFAGLKANIVSDAPAVVRVEGSRLIPLRGGFANITVSFVPDVATRAARSGGTPDYTIHVYVDRAMEASDIAFSVGGTGIGSGATYTTSKGSAELTVTLTAPDGAMEGKELWIGGKKVQTQDLVPSEDDKFVYTKTVSFSGAEPVSIDASVKFGERATQCDGTKTGTQAKNSCKLQSTDGKITSGLSVRLGEAPYGDGNDTLAFGDIGRTVSLKIDVSDPQPADFVLQEKDIAFYANDFFDADISVGENVATVTLTSKNGSYGENDRATLTVAGKTFSFKVKSEVLADTLKVECENKTLAEGGAYKTLLPHLVFTVTPSRTGKELTAAGKAVNYTFGTEGGAAAAADVNKKTFTFTVSPTAEETELTIESGTARVTLRLQRKELSDLAFQVKVIYTDNGGEVPLGPYALDAERIEAVFPKDMHGSFDIEIQTTTDFTDFLGGLYEETAKEYFALEEKAGWNTFFDVTERTAKYTVTPPVELASFAGETLTLHGGENTLLFAFSRVDLQSVEFVGFDSGDDSNKGDVYKGYQQVRVFAKHSDYSADGKTTVDYFRMPVKALSNLVRETPADVNGIAWTLTRVNDKTKQTQTLVTQIGAKVSYKADGKNVEYTIAPAEGDGPSTLQKEGAVIAKGGLYEASVAKEDRIPWIDVFAEENYAHIYFGNFGGLSEVDVQNDYFGNFGEKADWKLVEQTVTDAAKEGSGRDFTPSENAYTYLRVAAGDGTESGKANAHFNFNVLQDDALVNVFNAAGYYAHANIVLHENLYGPDEVPEAPAAQVLNGTSNLNKTVLYGNGYQVNMEAYNAVIKKDVEDNPILSSGDHKYKNGYNESTGVTFDRAYNAVIKCANPQTELDGKIQTLVLKMQYAYYCDLSYYYKFNPSNKKFYAKNTVFSCIPKAAVQLYYDNDVFYAENIVMTECGTSVQADQVSQQNIKIYYKGTIDILNYYNHPALIKLNAMVGGCFDMVAPKVKDYFEWHGKNVEARTNGSGTEKIYVNVLAFAASDLSGKMFVWNGTTYDKAGSATLGNNSKIVSKELINLGASFAYYAATYEMLDATGTRLDKASAEMSGAKFTGTANMDNLFSNDRYIRLQCEFKEQDVKNYQHIQWHKNTVYRDQSILGERKSHTEDLRDSLKNTRWADGSYVDANGDPHDPPAAVALAALLSETVVPAKQTY